MAVFISPAEALQAVSEAQKRLASPADGKPKLFLKAGIHTGTCLAVNLNGKLDYFGTAVNIASRLTGFSSGEDLVFSKEAFKTPELELPAIKKNFSAESFQTLVKGFGDESFELYRIRDARQS